MIGLVFVMFGLMARLTGWSVRLMIIACVWTVKLTVLMFAACAALLIGSSERLRR
jgi:hypothetical protein